MITVAKVGLCLAAGGLHASAQECSGETCMNEEASMLQLNKLADNQGKIEEPNQKYPWFYANNFVPYFNYEGSLRVKGLVFYTPTPFPSSDDLSLDGVLLHWKLSGLDPECEMGANSTLNGNSCGVHIHEGTSCDEDAGAHYWNSEARSKDPWGCIRYNSWSTRRSVRSVMTNVMVLDGYTFSDILGRTAIIHNFAGARIACAVIQAGSPPPPSAALAHRHMAPSGVAPLEQCVEQGLTGSEEVEYVMDECFQADGASPEAGGEVAQVAQTEESDDRPPPKPKKYCATNFVKYYNDPSPPNPLPKGKVWVSDAKVIGPRSDEALDGTRLSWNLKNLDPGCSEGAIDGGSANSCGIHIHEGTSCTDDAGPHYWNADAILEDPWTCIGYTATSSATSNVPQWSKFPVLSGYTLKDVIGRTIIIHDEAGARKACGIIEQC